MVTSYLLDAARLVAHCYRSSNFLISFLMSVRNEESLVDGARANVAAGFAAEPFAILRQVDPRSALARSMQVERMVWGDWVFNEIERGDINLPEMTGHPGSLWWCYGTWIAAPLRRRDHRMYNTYMLKWHQAWDAQNTHPVIDPTFFPANTASVTSPITELILPALNSVASSVVKRRGAPCCAGRAVVV